MTFDEFNLNVDVRYDGETVEFPTTGPTETDLLEDDKEVVKLAGFLVRQYADRIRSEHTSLIIAASRFILTTEVWPMRDERIGPHGPSLQAPPKRSGS